MANPERLAAPAQAGVEGASLLAELDSALAVASHGRQSFSEPRARAALYMALTRVQDRLADVISPAAAHPVSEGLQELLSALRQGSPLDPLHLDAVAWVCEARAAFLDEILSDDHHGR